MQTEKRILIADDNDLVRRGILALLSSQPGWVVCGEAADGPQAIHKAKELRPDVILLDISMPGMNGLETTRLLRKEGVTGRVIIISQHDPTHLLARALESGADACLDKSRLATELLPVIRKLI